MSLRYKFKKWYQGERIDDYQNTRSYGLPDFYYKKSTVAQILTNIVKFWLAHWRWIITTLVAVAAILVTLFIYLDSKAVRKTKAETANQHTEQHSTQIVHKKFTSSR